mmetsp:Transcript_105665/g.309026  ORF Transcript_105665/g.309026 Transcript_105665/m.309026 type:complete len:225 (-) Transcript_105665:1806-2480(-)
MIMKKSSRCKTAKSDSSLATMVAERMRCSSKRHASPNQAPVSMAKSAGFAIPASLSDTNCWEPRVAVMVMAATVGRDPSSTSRCASKCLPSDLGPKTALSRPWMTKATSRVSCPSSARISPGAHCTQTWACASSPTNDLLTPLKRGNWSTTSCSRARASSRCTVGVSCLKSSESIELWWLRCSVRRSMCSTRDTSSGATPRRRMKRTARDIRRSSGSSKSVPMA